MKTPQWTPGPWKPNPKFPENVVSASGVHIVCDVDYHLDASTAEANARLIAAAPALYEAARLALEEMCSITAPRKSFTYTIDKLIATLCKARGEQ